MRGELLFFSPLHVHAAIQPKKNSYLVIEEMAAIRVDTALNLAAVTLQLVERDPSVNVPVEVLHVEHLQHKFILKISGFPKSV